jgi:plasmid replication initiation protein
MNRNSRQNVPVQVDDALNEALAKLGENVRKYSQEGRGGQAHPAPPAANGQMIRSTLRPPPEGDAQPDFFVPSLYDIPIKDGIELMDIAVFRLSKKRPRRGETIRHVLPAAIVEVKGGADGMATVWDYDLILMMISNLADAERRARTGRGERPSKKFRPHAVEILKFCRLADGGKQYDNLSSTLDRLQGTFIKVTATDPRAKKTRRTGYFPLIAGAEIISRTDTGKIGQVEITIPDWIYEGVCNHKAPEVLTIDPDYFLITGGVARFIYRLARRAAGAGEARYYFHTLHDRSGSESTLKEFTRNLRAVIRANDLPGYHLAEESGPEGPILRMTSRAAALRAASGG